MTHKCPYCRQAVSEILIPPMGIIQRAIYNVVAESGSVGIQKAELCKRVLVESGKEFSIGRIRIYIHYLNKRTLSQIKQRITAEKHYGTYVLTSLEENISGTAAQGLTD